MEFDKIKMNHKSVTDRDTDKGEGKQADVEQNGLDKMVQLDIWVFIATSWP